MFLDNNVTIMSAVSLRIKFPLVFTVSIVSVNADFIIIIIIIIIINNNNNTSSELRRLKNQYFPFLDHFTLHDISKAMSY